MGSVAARNSASDSLRAESVDGVALCGERKNSERRVVGGRAASDKEAVHGLFSFFVFVFSEAGPLPHSFSLVPIFV